MARPTKQGIDYFPVDCQFDDKTELYILEKESTGLSVLVTIWQLIYQNEGYYIGNNKDLHLLIKKRINVDINEVNDCINICLSRNIFDNKLDNRQDNRTSYYPNGAIYIFKTKLILKRTYFSENTFAFIMSRLRSIDIDTLDDFNYAEYILRSRALNASE